MVGSKGVYSSSKSIMGLINLRLVFELNQNSLASVKVHSCKPVTLGHGIKYIVQFNCGTYEELELDELI